MGEIATPALSGCATFAAAGGFVVSLTTPRGDAIAQSVEPRLNVIRIR